MRQIIETTDNQFIGQIFDENSPIVLNGAQFSIEKIEQLADGVVRYSNANYVIDTKEVL